MLLRCAVDGVAVLSAATSPRYLDACAELAQTLQRHTSFRCLYVALPAGLPNHHPTLLAPAVLPEWARQFAVEPQFCAKRMSGWRQTHILKTQALLWLLSQGVNVLILDADRRLVGNPLPAFVSTGADVAAMRDEAFLNFGLLYMRSNERTIRLMVRVANRSLAAWDQAVLAEELSAATPISCCHANPWIRSCVRIEEAMHRLNKDERTAHEAQAEQSVACRGSLGATEGRMAGAGARGLPQAMHPPAGGGRLFYRWSATRYNELPLAQRKHSRCTRTPCRIEAAVAHATAAPGRPTRALEDACSITNASRIPPLVPRAIVAPSPAVSGAAVANTARHEDVPHALVDPLLRCTTWPAGSDGLPDEERCARGNLLSDGFTYYHNSERGTRRAVCGRRAACTCCRRPAAV